MDTEADNDKLTQKLAGPVAAILEKHKKELLPLMIDKSATLSHAALKNDVMVRTVATYCYGMLPGLVRFAVKEATFISFVMNNREKLLGRLVAGQEPEKVAPSPV